MVVCMSLIDPSDNVEPNHYNKLMKQQIYLIQTVGLVQVLPHSDGKYLAVGSAQCK